MGNIENKTVLDLPKEVQRIDSKTFEGYDYIETVKFHGEYIGHQAFKNCTSLKKVVFYNNCLIEYNAFEGCPNVETFVVYGDYIAQGDSVYDQEDVYYNGYGEIIFGESCHFIGSAHQKIQIQYRKKCEKKGIVKIPEGITYISTELMNCEEITEVILPKSLERIYYLAFGGCGKLKKIVLKGKRPTIVNNSMAYPDDSFESRMADFKDCIAGKNIIYPQGVIEVPEGTREIRKYDYWGYGKVTDIILPKSVKQIEENAFDGCTCLKRVGTREQLQNMRKEASHLMYRPFERLQDLLRKAVK